MACLMLVNNKTWACADMGDEHLAEVFSIYSNDYTYSNYERLMKYWAAYTGDKTPFSAEWQERYAPWNYYFDKDCARLMLAAKRKKDEEMQLYLRNTIKYNKICDDMQSRWEYPSAEKLKVRRNTLLSIQRAAKAYGGERLKPQFSLLLMRTNMLLKDYPANQEYWVLNASKLPESVFKDMMHSLYANAILNLGQWRKACDIYVKQGDWESMEWAMRNYRNPAGIKRVYKEDPNSPTLAYLLQCYVNGGYGWEIGYGRYIEEQDEKQVNADDTKQLLQMIETDVLHNAAVRDKAMWKAAQAMLYFNNNKPEQAFKCAQEAQKLNGSKRARHCARSIALLASTGFKPLGDAYSAYVVGELQWLMDCSDENSKKVRYSSAGEYYSEVMEYIMYNYLIPRYNTKTTTNERLALMAFMDHPHKPEYYKDNEETGLSLIWGEYGMALDSLTAKQMIAYYSYLNANISDPLLRLAVSRAYKNPDCFNDLIGTAFLREGNFAEAIPYLEKVGTKYLSAKGYNDYALNNDFKADRWFTPRPRPLKTVMNNGGKDNVKVQYCRDMLQLLSTYKLARNKEVQAEVAYVLGSRYFQASVYGDCWFLTRDYVSAYDSARSYEKDFVAEAERYLLQSEKSKNPELKLKSMFALAHMSYAQFSVGSLCTSGEWFEGLDDCKPIYNRYTNLAQYLKGLKTPPDYITKCDILHEFITKRMR